MGVGGGRVGILREVLYWVGPDSSLSHSSRSKSQRLSLQSSVWPLFGWGVGGGGGVSA